MNVSGIEIDVDRGKLTPVERSFLDRCATDDVGEVCVAVKLQRQRHEWALDDRFVITGSRIDAGGDLLRVGNRAFSAELNFALRSVSLHRNDQGDGSLRLTLRAIATSFLPTTGWIPLHAAAVDTGASSLAFCGRSGAGKSTLAATSPFPLLSDEMVAVRVRPALARGTSFWGDSVCKAPLGRASVPLRAIVMLEKSREFFLDRLTPSEAARTLVAATLTPATPAVWPLVLSQLARVVEQIDVYRMGWWKDEAPWGKLRAVGLFSGVDQSMEEPGRGLAVFSDTINPSHEFPE